VRAVPGPRSAQEVARARELGSRPVAVEAAVLARQPGQAVARAQESESQPVPAEAQQVWPRAREPVQRLAQAQQLAEAEARVLESAQRLEEAEELAPESAQQLAEAVERARELVPLRAPVAPESALRQVQAPVRLQVRALLPAPQARALGEPAVRLAAQPADRKSSGFGSTVPPIPRSRPCHQFPCPGWVRYA